MKTTPMHPITQAKQALTQAIVVSPENLAAYENKIINDASKGLIISSLLTPRLEPLLEALRERGWHCTLVEHPPAVQVDITQSTPP